MLSNIAWMNNKLWISNSRYLMNRFVRVVPLRIDSGHVSSEIFISARTGQQLQLKSW